MIELGEDFFSRDTVVVAKELVGKIVRVGDLVGRIVEVEAYKDDEASHAFKRSERSELMYLTYGYIYVYLIYGMYHCLNFTTDKNGPGAVLIRAIEPLSGISKMQKYRNQEKINNLCSGPGKLCQAFNIRMNFNSKKIGEEIKLFDDGYRVKLKKSYRIGITKARNLKWRFFEEDNIFVSKIKN